jgi:hypothetical protein
VVRRRIKLRLQLEPPRTTNAMVPEPVGVESCESLFSPVFQLPTIASQLMIDGMVNWKDF